ncbi:phosphatase PAP2 family protein [Paenibacillus sp. chi10]|uniref:Phosphatase PAP2 family protein n=1 Tax=Paenibacillus suaedae TaxID=3077233 RepID=A0AAJ2JT23_9BACL|nr:phosphatase PAP2 family protein [Paenibacillus sp. chi10]MDT8976211.1 phosphatase PAP2 family protein [Paenibacillus sp. chi10]
MNRKLSAYIPLLWLLAIPVLNICYGLLNHGNTIVHDLSTDLDQEIPFIPAFIIPYVIWYPYILTVLVLVFRKQRNVYYRTLLSLCAGLVICYMVYAVYQTTVPRPEIGEPGLLTALVQLVYQTDAPFNCFPSIHVFTSYLMIKAVSDPDSQHRFPYLRAIVLILSWAIIVSTLFVKQHVFMDVAAGIVVADLVYNLIRKWLSYLNIVP